MPGFVLNNMRPGTCVCMYVCMYAHYIPLNNLHNIKNICVADSQQLEAGMTVSASVVLTVLSQLCMLGKEISS